MKRGKKIEYLIIGVMTVVMVILCTWIASREVKAQGLKQITATGYYDAYGHGIGYDGRLLVPGLTLAGRKEDLGKTAVIYDMDYHLIGIYEFRDIGYGRPTGFGKSSLKRGKSLGDIETGQAVDIYMSRQQAMTWGRKKILIQIINARG